MTRKDYIRLADVIKWEVLQNLNDRKRWDYSYRTAYRFANEYENFNKEIFNNYILDQITNNLKYQMDNEEIAEVMSYLQEVTFYSYL